MALKLFFYPLPRVDVATVPAVSHAGAVLLTGTIHTTGLAGALREALEPWTKPLVEHHGARMILDLAMTLAIGGEVVRDTDLLRSEEGRSGQVAFAPTISRLLSSLAQDAPAATRAISRARRDTRERAWALAGEHSPAARAVRRILWSSTWMPPGSTSIARSSGPHRRVPHSRIRHPPGARRPSQSRSGHTFDESFQTLLRARPKTGYSLRCSPMNRVALDQRRLDTQSRTGLPMEGIP